MQFPELRGRVVVVTGAGRPQGIGAAICRGFADQGCTIFFTTYTPYDKAMYRDDPQGKGAAALVEELRRRDVLASFIEADLAQLDCAEFILDSVEERFGKPSILVNKGCTPNGAWNLREPLRRWKQRSFKDLEDEDE